MSDFAWCIPLFPLLASLLLTMGARRYSDGVASLIASCAVFISAAISIGVLMETLNTVVPTVHHWRWLSFGDQSITVGAEVNQLNALMLVIVSLVSFLVHRYARGYMAGDRRMATFYAYLSLFTFSMLGLVISPNLLQLYVFWELVGVCSFLLIGFWFYKPEAKRAARKAFILTRIGDVGLFIAVILTFWQVGSFEWEAIFAAISANKIPPEMITLIALLIFVGAVGKSGQFPLHSWLPDAMEGPTPVSALIHAATMVAAGAYLVARAFPIFAASDVALGTVAYVGAFTAIFAATIGLVQNDIKRILAWSTVSQLGYMMLALGSSGYVAGIFHLTTHASFKALLFLAAGAIITMLHHEQDIRRMGGLWKSQRRIGWLFLIGCLAITGIPPFSGFFSKEEILTAAWLSGRVDLFLVGVVTAFLTALYIFRLFFLVFMGEERGKIAPSQIPRVMIWPMVLLTIPAIGAGFLAWIPAHGFSDWLTKGTGILAAPQGEAPGWIPLLTLLLSLAGVGVAWLRYGRGAVTIPSQSQSVTGIHHLLSRAYFVDDLYRWGIGKPYRWLSILLSWVDQQIISGIVSGVGALFQAGGRIGSRMQNGQAQTYALVSLLGLVIVIVGLTAGRWFG
ncbi:NADH-quinone oxidoreductase subunit L [Marininema halotolerans]|uniref:NADH-quinone oxidoreductase subunit L n=1 Tax=Marininema halotolerans TaxID=1155944 RepID=A0A1I6P231_9BACL|nr:NADH-quinone oxidoreductase subunit L [Marininema halotolerans]SFS34254.1 NADH-quinone oxidoreductase subunit L [Marininema halotolerans]